MAIKRSAAAASETELPLVVNNGDLVALKDAVERLGFKDEESLLRFALAVISKSVTTTLTVTDKDGKTVALNPSPLLLRQPPTPTPPTPPASIAAPPPSTQPVQGTP